MENVRVIAAVRLSLALIATAELNNVSGELRDLVRKLNQYLAQGATHDR